MDYIKNALEASLKSKQMRDLVSNKDPNVNFNIKELLEADELSFNLCKVALKKMESENNPPLSREDFTLVLSKLKTSIEELDRELIQNSNILLSNFGAPVGQAVINEGKVVVELVREVPVGSKLYLSQVINPADVEDLTIEDIRACVNLGEYENMFLPAIEKIITKFKEKNNIL